MTIVKTIRKTIGRAVLTVGAVTVGTALAAFSRTEKGKELRRAVEEKVTSGIAAMRSRFFGPESQPANEAPEAIEQSAKLEHEHALEHGPEGRKWAASHSHKPHAPEAPPMSTGVRFATMRRVARHV